jgi:apolipoprotein N-acyltransferase
MNRRGLALAGLSGLLLAASFPPIDLDFLAWIALVPLLHALRGRTPKQAFWLSGVAGLIYFCGTIYWVTNSVNFYGHVPLLPATLITLLLCAYCSLYPALFGAAAVRLRDARPAVFFATAPALWTTLELARTYVFSGFPWVLLGYTQYRHIALIQVADVTGVYGISFLIVLVNASIAEILADRKALRSLIVAAVIAAAVLAYGTYRLRHTGSNGSIRISVVQGNIEQDRKWDPAYQSEVIATYHRLTGEALKDRPDLIIWPETATPFYFGGEGDSAVLTKDLRRFVRSIGTPLLTGTPTYERTGQGYLLRNSAVFLNGDGAVEGIYTKHHLVPFGEYVPLKSSILFFVDKLVQAIGDFQPGSEYTVAAVRSAATGTTVRVSTVICYEIIFPNLVRQFVSRGAAVMTNITNDAWFGKSSAPYQHFSMAVLRAVENHVPIARAANTGISGYIDANGRILAESGIFTEAELTQTLFPGSSRTFYTRYGDLFSYLCVIATIAPLVFPAKRKYDLKQRRVPSPKE